MRIQLVIVSSSCYRSINFKDRVAARMQVNIVPIAVGFNHTIAVAASAPITIA